MVLYTVIGFLIVPAVVKSQMLKRLPPLTKRQAAIERVKFNPYAFAMTIDGFSLKETNGDVFSSFSEFYVRFQLSSIFRRSWNFADISLQDPFAQITYLKDGTFNFANLLGAPSPAPAPAPRPAQPLPPIIVHHLLITNGAVAFEDQTRRSPFKIRYQPINVSLKDFTTLLDQSSPHEIVATGDSGESIAWSGHVTVNPLQATGTFRLGGFKLGRYKPYSQDYALFEIADGQLDASAEYRYDSATNALDLEVSNAMVTFSHLRLKTPDTGEDVLTIPSLSLKQIEASVARRTAKVGQIKSEDGSILVRRNQDGTINFLANLVPQPKPAPTQSLPVATPPWSVKIDEIAFHNYAIKAEDRQPPKPAAFNIDQLNLNLKNVSNQSNAPVTLALSLRLQETGSIGVNGALTLIPPWADVLIGVTNLDLRMIQPYLDEQLKMSITRGVLNLDGHAHYSPARQGAPLVSFAGNVSVRDFAVTDQVLFENLAKWDSLDITGIDTALQPDKFHVDQIKFVQADNSAIIGPDRRLNILTILPEKKASLAEANTPAPTTNTIPEITLGAFVFENASLHFADRSLEPNCTFDVQDASGSVKGISSLVLTPAAVDVKGKVDQFSSFSVTGSLNPMPDKLFVDVSVAFTNAGLTAFSPYTEKYVGRPLEKGKLSLALHYDINQKALNASNFIFIDQLTLGAKNGSTNATSLPVKLAIALLKDRNGRIKLDVPVQGRVDDPKFKLGPIIWGVVENLLVKAATSPFSLLGAMFGSSKELSINFDPGLSDILPVETNTLDALSKALYDRPELTLEINGSVDPAMDREVMARARLQRQLKALFIKEMTDAGKPPASVDEVVLQPADHDRLLAAVYTNTFGAYHPPETNQLPGAPAPLPRNKPAPNPPPPAKPFFANGATRLVLLSHPGWVLTSPPAVISKQAQLAQAAVAQSDLAGMEEQLLQKIDITSDDFRQLMQDRANQVEAYLLKSGRVTADRLFITAPKPIGANFKGQDRVNLTLD